MTNLPPIEPTAIFAAGVALSLIVLLVLEFYNNHRVTKLTYPVYEYALKRSEEEANRIVAAAKLEARKLIETAEAESIKLAGARKSEEEAAEAAYQEALKTLLGKLEAQFNEHAKSVSEAETRINTEAVAEMKEGAASLASNQKKTLDALEAETGKRIDEHLTAAFATADKEIAEYERARKEMIDHRIVDLVGETMKIVLHKNLPETVHADMVRAALEEAKANRVF
jgi:hypothetical protein